MNKNLLIIVFMILIAIIVVAMVSPIDFATPSADRMILRCEGNLECYSEIDINGGFTRFFTMIDANTGRISKVILIEDFPLVIREADLNIRR